MDQLVDELERRASLTESTELPIAGRSARLKALLQEVIGALRSGGAGDRVQPPSAMPPFSDAALELRERELVRRHLIDRIKRQQLEASCEEMVVVAECPVKLCIGPVAPRYSSAVLNGEPMAVASAIRLRRGRWPPGRRERPAPEYPGPAAESKR